MSSFLRGNKDCSQKYERNFGIPETISSAGAKLQQPVRAHNCSNTSSMASGHPVPGKRPNLRASMRKKLEGAKRSTVTSKRNFFYANMNGYKSKADSLKKILVTHNVDVFMLNETKVYSESAIKVKGYQVFPAVQKRNCGGGLSIGVRQGLCKPLMADHGENAEFLTVKLILGGNSYRIILVYGPQENVSEEVRKEFFQNVQIPVNRAFLSGDSIILLDDFNAKLCKLIIPGDIHDMSPSGKFLNDIIENSSLKVLNTHKNSKGIFIRVQKNLGRVERSVLDYVLVTHDLYEMLISMDIDESKSVTPYRN